jgi:hypothetical protein
MASDEWRVAAGRWRGLLAAQIPVPTRHYGLDRNSVKCIGIDNRKRNTPLPSPYRLTPHAVQKAGGFFHTIKTSKLKRGVKEALEEVFLSWLGQRLPNRTKQEIEKMLVGELPELLETRMAQDILKIGEERGLAKAVLIVLGGKRGRLTKALRQRIGKLTNDQLCQLLSAADAWQSLDPLDAWLAEHGQ